MTFLDGSNPFQHRDSWLLLGICGAGMRSLCEHLTGLGISVIGSDRDASGMELIRRLQLPRLTLVDWDYLQHKELPRVSTVVHSVAVDRQSSLVRRFLSQNLRVFNLPEALSAQFSHLPQYCVAGTHGKSTTTGMLWWILHQAGHSVARFVGAEFQGEHSGPGPAGSPAGPFDSAVIEACEYRDSFVTLSPGLCVLTGVEQDHFDWFDDMAAAEAGFRRFLNRIPVGGGLIYSADCEVSRRLAGGLSGIRCVSWSEQPGRGDWHLRADSGQQGDRRGGLSGRTGDIITAGRLISVGDKIEYSFQLRVAGVHNLRNAAGAILAAVELGVAGPVAARHLATFGGMRRRLEHRGMWRGVDLIDDYAHHPTAVACALRTVRELYPGRRILAVFEPHQMSRTVRLFEEFAAALALADCVFVLPVLPAREVAGADALLALSNRLVDRILKTGGQAKLIGNLDHSTGTLEDAARVGDVIITMGAGRTNLIHDEIHRKLYRDSAA